MTGTTALELHALLTPADLAARWSITEGHLRNLRYQGRGVPYLKLQGRVAYRISDVRDFEESSRVMTDPAIKTAPRRTLNPFTNSRVSK